MKRFERALPVVAIDGPAGAGKSTVTRLVAEHLGYTRVDTGALYRTVALMCVRRGIDLANQERVGKIAQELAVPGVVELTTRGEAVTVKAFGEDITAGYPLPRRVARCEPSFTDPRCTRCPAGDSARFRSSRRSGSRRA